MPWFLRQWRAEPGLLQSLDPRVRLAGLLVLVIAVTLSHKIVVVVALFAVAVVLRLAIAGESGHVGQARLADSVRIHRHDCAPCAVSHPRQMR